MKNLFRYDKKWEQMLQHRNARRQNQLRRKELYRKTFVSLYTRYRWVNFVWVIFLTSVLQHKYIIHSKFVGFFKYMYINIKMTCFTYILSKMRGLYRIPHYCLICHQPEWLILAQPGRTQIDKINGWYQGRDQNNSVVF